MPDNHNSKSAKTKTYKILKVFGIILIIVAIISIILFLMHGETKKSGNHPEPEISHYISCEKEGNDFPFFTYNNSTKETTKINVIFNGDILESISLTQKLYYNDSEQIKTSEAMNHASMNFAFADDGLEADSFEAHYVKLKDSMSMNLSANAPSINHTTGKYFLLNEISNDSLSMQKIKNAFEEQGFYCSSSDSNK